MSASEAEAIVVVGPCSATDKDLTDLLGRDVPGSALTEWAGAYTIIQAQPGRVTVSTDPAGACPIYTTKDENGALVWGSSSRALASLANSDVDENWLAAFLVNPYAERAGISAFTSVSMVPPGHRLTMIGRQVRDLTPIWAPKPLRLSDAVEQLRATLTAAVQVRVIATTPAADLSGGMDSTTLAVLAAQAGPVTAVTVHPDGVTAGGDVDHARLTAAANPNMRHVLLPLNDLHLPFTALESLPATDEPAPSSLTWAMLSAQLHMLAEIGVNCHLTGDGGDTLFLSPPVYLADLARCGRWLRMAADAQGWARLRRISPWPLLATAISGNTRSLGTGAVSTRWLTRHALRLASAARATEDSLGLNHADRDLVTRTRFTARTAHTETQLADTFGITMHNPYLDARVLDIVLGVDGWLRGSPYRYKPLLATATAGLLPETVRNRAAKGVFAGDHHQGLRNNLPATLGLADGRLAERGLVTPRQLQNEILTAAAGRAVQWGHLQRVLAAELWLRSVETSIPIEWTVPEILAEAA